MGGNVNYSVSLFFWGTGFERHLVVALATDKRAQILEGAVETFQELGFAGTSMDRVAARAKVSKRTVYNHFESKEVLFRAILDHMTEAVQLALQIEYEPGKPIAEQLHAVGWAEGRLLTDPQFMRMARMVVGETMRDPVLAAQMNERMQHKAVFGRFMAAAHAGGDLRAPDPTLAAEQFIGLIKSRAFWPVVFSGVPVDRAAMEDIVRDAIRLFLKGYGPG